jgi:type II secretory pathway component GspD/PulD (secretin)
MHAIVVGLAVIATFASAQDRDRTFYLTHTPTVQQFQEVATVIRTIADIKQVSADNDQKSVTVRTTPGQIAMAEWLFNELDNPAAQTSVSHQYLVPGGSDDVVRVFYIATAPTTQDFQEISTLVRTIGNITRVFTYNAPKALVVRGTAVQIGLAEWLVKELEPKTSPSSAEYQVVPGDNPHDENTVRVLYFTHTGTVQDFQKAATQIRTATNITRVFTYNRGRALAVRGTAEKVAMADSLAKNLDHP